MPRATQIQSISLFRLVARLAAVLSSLLVFANLAVVTATLQAQDLRVGQRLTVIAEKPFEVDFVDGGTATVDHNHLFLFFESAPNYHICYFNGQPALIPTRRVATSDKAIEIISRRCEDSPSAANFLSLAYAKLVAGHYRACLESCDKGLELDPDDLELKIIKGKTLGILDQDDESDLFLDELLKEEIESKRLQAIVLDWQAGNAHADGDPETGMELGAEAIELEPYSPRMRCNLGLMSYAMEDYEVAKQQFEKAREFDPANSIPLTFLGYVAGQESMDQAIPLMQQAVELDPGASQPWSYLHWNAESKGEQGEADSIAIKWALARSTSNDHRFKVAWNLATSEDDEGRDYDTAKKIQKRMHQTTTDDQVMSTCAKMVEAAILIGQDKTEEAKPILDQIMEFEDIEYLYPTQFDWLNEAIDE